MAVIDETGRPFRVLKGSFALSITFHQLKLGTDVSRLIDTIQSFYKGNPYFYDPLDSAISFQASLPAIDPPASTNYEHALDSEVNPLTLSPQANVLLTIKLVKPAPMGLPLIWGTSCHQSLVPSMFRTVSYQ